MKKLLIILALCSMAHAVTVTVTSVEPTSHQAIVRYHQTGGPGACTFAGSPEDINNTDFPGSNSDARPETATQAVGDGSTGPDRVFVLGSPHYDTTAGGNVVGRSLQNSTKYSGITVTCAGATATLPDFTTGVPPWNNPLIEPAEALLPTIDYNRADRETSANFYIEPHTGTAFRLLTSPMDVTAAPFTSVTGKTFTATSDPSGNWTTPSNMLTAGQYAVYSGTTQDKVCLTINQTLTSHLSLDSMRFYLTGHSDAGVGDVDSVNVQMTFNCTVGSGPIYKLLLPVTDSQQCEPTNCAGGIPIPIDYTWGNPQPVRSQVSGNASFGFLIWKASTGTGTVSVGGTVPKIDFNMSPEYQFGNEGSQALCANQIRNDPSGNPGAVCDIQSAGGNPGTLYWIGTSGATAGVGRFLYYTTIDSGHLVDKNGAAVNSTCSAGGCYSNQIGGTWDRNKLAFYDKMTDTANSSKQVLVEADLPASGNSVYGASQAVNNKTTVANGVTWRNLTPVPNDWMTQVAAFNPTCVPANGFNSIRDLYYMTGDNLLTFDVPGLTQNTLACLGAIDPATGNVVALTTHEWDGLSNPPDVMIANGEHSMVPNDSSYLIDENHDPPNAFTTTLATPGCQGTIDCSGSPASVQTGTAGDLVQLIVTGDPTASVAPTNIGHIQVGAQLKIGAESYCVTLLGSDAFRFTAQRGCQASPTASHANGATVTLTSNMGNFSLQQNGAFFCDVKNDPTCANPIIDHGQPTLTPTADRSGSHAVGSHQDMKQCTPIPGVECRIGANGYNTYIGTDFIHTPNDTLAPNGQASAGPFHLNCTGNGCQSHPGVSHAFFASASRRLFGLDAHVFNGIAPNYGLTTQAGLVNVTGDLWKGPRNAFTVGGQLTSITIASTGVATATTTVSNNVGTADLVYISGAVSNPALNGWWAQGAEQTSTTATFRTTLGAGGPYNVASGDTGMTIAFLRVAHDYVPSLELAYHTILKDVSGPGSNLIGDGTDDNEVCYVRNAGECRAGSLPGEWFATSPAIDAASICSPTATIALDDFCFMNHNNSMAAIMQIRVDRNDAPGHPTTRTVLQAPVIAHGWSQGATAFTLPDESHDGSGLLWGTAAFDRYGRNADVYTYGIPPEGADSNAPEDFAFIADSPDSSGAVDHVIEKFGYTRSFHATQRNEVSVATQHLYDDTKLPFGYLGDAKNSVSMPGVATIPVARDRVVYRQILYYDSGNNLLRTSGGPGCGATPCATIERTQ